MAQTKKSFWDMEQTICEIPQTEKKKIVVKNVEKSNKKYIDVRNMFVDTKTGEWQHGKGIAIPLENAQDVIDVMQGAIREFESLPF